MSQDRERPKGDVPEDSDETPVSSGDDNICDGCDSTGEVDGRVCKTCSGKGYLNPS